MSSLLNKSSCSCWIMLLHPVALLQQSLACAAHNYLDLATRVVKLSTLFACTTLSSSWFQSTVVLGKKDVFPLLSVTVGHNIIMVCRCALHSCSLDYMIFGPAVACGFACQVFVVAGTFQEGVLVSIPQLFYKRWSGVGVVASPVEGGGYTFGVVLTYCLELWICSRQWWSGRHSSGCVQVGRCPDSVDPTLMLHIPKVV